MKTSIKLLTGITVAVLLTMVGAGWSFRQQYDKLDHTDPFAQFSRQTLPAFRVLKLIGSQGEAVLVQPGTSPTLRAKPEQQADVTYKVTGDTLLVRFVPVSPGPTDYNEMHAGDASGLRPVVVISTPVLQTVQVERANCKLVNWKLPSLMLTQTGEKGAIALENTTIDTLEATMLGKSLLSMEGKNTIARATVTVKGKASFIVGNTKFTSLVLHADSTALIAIPGALLAKIR